MPNLQAVFFQGEEAGRSLVALFAEAGALSFGVVREVFAGHAALAGAIFIALGFLAFRFAQRVGIKKKAGGLLMVLLVGAAVVTRAEGLQEKVPSWGGESLNVAEVLRSVLGGNFLGELSLAGVLVGVGAGFYVLYYVVGWSVYFAKVYHVPLYDRMSARYADFRGTLGFYPWPRMTQAPEIPEPIKVSEAVIKKQRQDPLHPRAEKAPWGYYGPPADGRRPFRVRQQMIEEGAERYLLENIVGVEEADRRDHVRKEMNKRTYGGAETRFYRGNVYHA